MLDNEAREYPIIEQLKDRFSLLVDEALTQSERGETPPTILARLLRSALAHRTPISNLLGVALPEKGPRASHTYEFPNGKIVIVDFANSRPPETAYVYFKVNDVPVQIASHGLQSEQVSFFLYSDGVENDRGDVDLDLATQLEEAKSALKTSFSLILSKPETTD